MIRIQNLVFSYPHSSFQLVIPTWELPAGAQVAVIGPSGSGKTTMLHLLAGILAPQQGQILFDSFDVVASNEGTRRNFRAAQIGLVFQRFELIEYLNVAANILLPYRVNRSLRMTRDVSQRFQKLTTRTGIASLLDRPIQRLSQGEQQRVAICRALITQPRWVLADEPTGNLDPENKQLIVDLLQEQSQATGATLIMVTHDVTLVSRFSEQIDFRNWQRRLPASIATAENDESVQRGGRAIERS